MRVRIGSWGVHCSAFYSFSEAFLVIGTANVTQYLIPARYSSVFTVSAHIYVYSVCVKDIAPSTAKDEALPYRPSFVPISDIHNVFIVP